MMPPSMLGYPAARVINRVLRDYPLARAELAGHAGKVVAIAAGPVQVRVRITAQGEVEMVGEGAPAAADVSMIIPLAALPALARKEAAAYSQVSFSGDGELASLLSTLARNLEWDIEEDLSGIVGDIAAHRVVDTARRTHAWRVDAGTRLAENVAEYLTEEKRAFIARADLETLALDNETLRDDVARLAARLDKLSAGKPPA